MTTTLRRFSAARRALAEARNIDEVKDVRDKAEALRAYAIQRGESHEMQNDIAEIKVRAERRIGELIPQMQERGELVRQGQRQDLTDCKVLADYSINYRQSSQWQASADLPDEIFERYIAETKTDVEELTSVGVYRLAKKLQREADRKNNHNNSNASGLYTVEDGTIIMGDAREMDLAQFPDRYGVIIADPPWAYRVSRMRGVAEEFYTVMTDEDIAAMPVESLAADDCVLLLWATWPKLPIALDVMAAWSFDYVTGIPWVKTTSKSINDEMASDVTLSYGVGFWFRGVSEVMLLGRRGKPTKPSLNFAGILSPSFKHSRKPDSVHQIAEAMPGPYLELFARRSRPGWTVFGNEIQGVMI